MKTIKRAFELKELINKYDKQYYEEGISEISDAEYDRLYTEYQELEKEFPELALMSDSPTKKVGAGKDAGTTTGLPKFTHKSPLLSIDRKSKTIEDLKKFYEDCGGDGVEMIVEPKLDGITCNINYENGKFSNAATRGNGYIGDLITDNFKMTDTIYPETLSNDVDLEIRGEAIIPFDFFKSNLMNEYSNPRNAVAGIMRQIEPNDVKGKGIKVMFYDLGTYKNIIFEDNDYDNVDFIKALGFGSVPVVRVSTFEQLKDVVESNFNGMIQQIDGFNVLVAPKDEKHDLDYPMAVCDGLVIKVASKHKRDEIGFSQKGPKWAFAFKFKPLRATTRIDRVEWQVGKSGRVTPVAVFDEISLGGTKITRATLNNFEYLQNLPTVDSLTNEPNLDSFSSLMIDDTIMVERSNDVIPRVVGIVNRGHYLYTQDMKTTELYGKRLETFNEPTVCPVCGATLKREGPLHFCINPLCSAQIKGKIEHFASRNAMNIVGLGEGVIDVLFEEGFLNSIRSIYDLKDHKDDLERIERFGKKKVDNLLKNIEKSKNVSLDRFIYSLSITNIGRRASKDLSIKFHTIDNFLKATKEELMSIDGFSDITADNVLSYIHNDSFVDMINELLKVITIETKELASDKFKGLSFVITGTLQNPRSYYQEIIEKNGGKVAGSVSKKTYAVLIGADAGSKETKARDLVAKGENIIILDNEEMIMDFLNK